MQITFSQLTANAGVVFVTALCEFAFFPPIVELLSAEGAHGYGWLWCRRSCPTTWRPSSTEKTCWGASDASLLFSLGLQPLMTPRLSLQRILWAKRADDGGGGSRHRGAARRAERHRCQSVYEGRGPGLSGALTFTRDAVLALKRQIENGQHLLTVGLLASALQVGVIDFSMYLKDGGHSSKSAEGWVLLPPHPF